MAINAIHILMTPKYIYTHISECYLIGYLDVLIGHLKLTWTLSFILSYTFSSIEHHLSSLSQAKHILLLFSLISHLYSISTLCCAVLKICPKPNYLHQWHPCLSSYFLFSVLPSAFQICLPAVILASL